MNKPLTMRQVVLTYLFISLSPVLRQIPTALAGEAGRSGYLSPFWSALAILPLASIILLLIKSYPGLNIYEIMVELLGKFIAKGVLILYIFWVLFFLSAKLNAYSLILQFTLMPKTKSNYFVLIMFALVYYALYRGTRTIFRFAEFTLGPIIFLISIIFICSIGNIRTDYLLPVTSNNLPATIKASKSVIAVGGNLIIALFFADELAISISNKQKRKFYFATVGFVGISFLITVFTFGITGPSLTATLPFPFYITVKSLSFFNVFERFEVIVTLLCVLSDFVTICIMFLLLMRLIQWLFDIVKREYLFLPLAVIVYYLTYLVSSTQFEYDFLYRYLIVNLNLVFQYLIPLILGLLCLIKGNNMRKKQY